MPTFYSFLGKIAEKAIKPGKEKYKIPGAAPEEEQPDPPAH